jgi:hypothetical protein
MGFFVRSKKAFDAHGATVGAVDGSPFIALRARVHETRLGEFEGSAALAV